MLGVARPADPLLAAFTALSILRDSGDPFTIDEGSCL